MNLRLAYLVMNHPEIFLVHELLGLSRLGFTLNVFCLRGRGPKGSHVNQELIQAGIPLWYGTYVSWAVVRDMVFWLRHKPGSLLYIMWLISRHTWRNPVQWAQSIALVPKSFSVARVVQRDDIQIVHAAWGHYPAITLCLIKHLMPQVKVTMALGAYDLVARHPISRIAAELSEYVFTQSDASAQIIQHEWPRPTTPVVTIMRAVDVEMLEHVSPAPTIPGLIVSVGRLKQVKGHHHVIRAFASIHADHTETRLVIFGEGDYRAELEKLIAELELIGVVELPGQVEQRQVFERLSQAAVFVLASEWEGENLPNVVKEAMALGVPVITTFTTGIEALVHHGETGFLVDQGDVAAIETHLRRLLADSALRQTMGERSQTVIREQFDLRQTSQHRAELYRQL